MIQIQLLSDLHLEQLRPGVNDTYQFDFAVTAPILALLGDIGSADDLRLGGFLETQCSRYTKVLYVMGNHEPYKMEMNAALDFLLGFEKNHDNFIFLHRKRHDLDRHTTILGCTLWSHITEEGRPLLKDAFPDFRFIKDFNVDAYNALHAEELDWLRQQLIQIRKEEPNRQVIVMTHHAPTIEDISDPKFKGSPYNSAFSTELTTENFWQAPLKYWLFGHTHYSCNFERKNVSIIANQRGYYGEETGFDPNLVVSIETGPSLPREKL